MNNIIFCPLFSGSSGNSTLVGNDTTKILIDAGGTGINIEKSLKSINVMPSDINAIFVTHEHQDHFKGAGILSRRYNIPIYASNGTFKAIENNIGNIKPENKRIIETEVFINDVEVRRFNISHDCIEPTGYSILTNNLKICIATDIGIMEDDVRKEIHDSNIVLLESNHDEEMLKFGPYPYILKKRILSEVGHLSNENCGKTIVETFNSKKKYVVLGHLSETNNTPELALKTVENIINESKIKLGKDVILKLAKKYEPSAYINLNLED